MHGDIVVAMDGHPAEPVVLAVAQRLARTVGAGLRLVRVFDVPPEVISARAGLLGAMDETRALAAAMLEGLEHAAERSRAQGIATTATVLDGGDVGDALLGELERASSRAIVMATRSHGALRRALLGSVAQRVAREADVPVVLVPAACPPPATDGALSRVLLPIDGTPASAGAADLLVDAAPAGLEVVVLRVAGPAVRPPETDAASRVTAETVAERLATRGVRARTMDCDSPLVPEGILEAAGDAQVELIAMTTHVRGGLARLAHGSITDTVVRSATVPVLVVKSRDT